ncbi:glycosyltransferase, partial [Candidatus Saccharibacteria bacterium]|nr:glycosyltransferase [Candidatus Saccharibacteria bacterium]
PTLSIIIPVYNASQSIANLVDHVLSQEFRDFELFLIDDGSTDDSLKIIRGLAKNDSRITVVHKKNGGASSARNVGLKKMRGKYVMLLDADDDIDPTMISKLVNKITVEKVDLVTCSILFNHIKNGKIISSTDAYPRPTLTRRADESFITYVVRLLGTDGRLYNPSNKIYRADLIRKYNLEYEVGLNFGEDLTFNLHYLSVARKIAFIDEPLYIYYFNIAENTSGKSSIIYANRVKNYQEVERFADKEQSAELASLLGWIKYYWFYSFVLALCASPLSRRERIERLRDALAIDALPKPGDKQYIGKAKHHLESIFYHLRKRPMAIYQTVLMLNFCKNNQTFAKVWRKFASRLLR